MPTAENVKLREYLEALIRNLEESTDDKFLAAEKALETADRVNEMRLASMNEFRAALTDQAATFITKTEYDVSNQSLKQEINGLCDDIESLKLSRAELSGKATQSQFNIAMAVSLLGLLTGLIGIVFRLLGK